MRLEGPINWGHNERNKRVAYWLVVGDSGKKSCGACFCWLERLRPVSCVYVFDQLLLLPSEIPMISSLDLGFHVKVIPVDFSVW